MKTYSKPFNYSQIPKKYLQEKKKLNLAEEISDSNHGYFGNNPAK